MVRSGNLDSYAGNENIYPTFEEAKQLGLLSLPKPKRRHCMYCENCQKPDCGKCANCLDKKKFGGKNIKRKPCVQRTCLNEQKVRIPQIDIPSMYKMESANPGSENLNSKLKALFDDPDDEAYWKEFCEAKDVNDGQREVRVDKSKIDDVKVYKCQYCDATYTNFR
jgi:hypothetical protein